MFWAHRVSAEIGLEQRWHEAVDLSQLRIRRRLKLGPDLERWDA
jgi:hypothetical protein